MQRHLATMPYLYVKNKEKVITILIGEALSVHGIVNIMEVCL